jgi:hypothetical protein
MVNSPCRRSPEEIRSVISRIQVESLSQLALLDNDIVTCRVVRVTGMTGSSSDYWIYYHFGYNLS